MSHVDVPGEGLRTSFTPAPTVRVLNVPDAPTTMILEFPSGLTVDGVPAPLTRLTFGGVMEYRWITTGFVYFTTDRGDRGFKLIEITNSELKELLLSRSMWRQITPGERLGGVLKENQLRHFRIGFDEHGHYDVLCVDLAIEQVAATVNIE